MHGVKKLAQALGDDALQQYCMNGFLDQSIVNRVEAVEFLDSGEAPTAHEASTADEDSTTDEATTADEAIAASEDTM